LRLEQSQLVREMNVLTEDEELPRTASIDDSEGYFGIG
jgi:hypothetical protein